MPREPLSERQVYLAAFFGALATCTWVIIVLYAVTYLLTGRL